MDHKTPDTLWTTTVSTSYPFQTFSQVDPYSQQPPVTVNNKRVTLASQTTQRVDQETQTDPAPFLKDRIAAKATANGQTVTTATTDANTPAADTKKTEKTVVEFHKPNWKERFVATLKTIGSYIAAPFKFAAKVIDFLVWKPLKNFVITPIYVGFLYLFQPAKFEARKMGLEAEANKAAHERKQANDHALDKECIDLARAQYDKTTTDLMYTRLAAKYGVKAKDVEKRVELHKPHTDANEEFNTKLADGSLALLKQVGVDPETGEKQYRTHTVLKATDQVLDADKADVAKRLGNDSNPEFRKQLDEYNKAVEAHAKAMAEHAKAVNKAEKKGVSAPAAPVLTAKPPVFKCTDERLIQAFRNESSVYLSNVKAKRADLINELIRMRAELKEAHPNADPMDLEFVILNADHKAQVEDRLKTRQKSRQEQQVNLAKWKTEGNNHPETQLIRADIDELNREINIIKRNLAIYSKECELWAVHEEINALEVTVPVYQKKRAEDIADRQNRDRLNTKDWKAPVAKDEKGNILDIYTRNADGKITGIDKAKSSQMTHFERPWDQKTIPTYNGRKMPNPVPYKDQKGERWSKTNPEQRPYDSYVAVKGEDSKILKDSKGNVVDWEAAAGQLNNHWVVKPSYVNGKHEGYDKFKLAVKKPELTEEENRDAMVDLISFDEELETGELQSVSLI